MSSCATYAYERKTGLRGLALSATPPGFSPPPGPARPGNHWGMPLRGPAHRADGVAGQDEPRPEGRQVCLDTRDILGGNGLLIEHHVARHLTDMEVVHTYEGTDSI